MAFDYCGKCPCYDNEVNACNFPYTDCQELFEYYKKIGYQQGRVDQREEDLHGFTEEEVTQYLYDLGCKDTIKLYHKYVEANLEANNFDVLINNEIQDTLLSKSVEEVLKMIDQIKEQKND